MRIDYTITWPDFVDSLSRFEYERSLGRINVHQKNCIAEIFLRTVAKTFRLVVYDGLELDEIGAQEQLKDELECYQRFNGILGYIGKELIQKPAIDLKAYAKYVLQSGTKEEKREILKYVNGELFPKDQKVYVERKPRSKKFN